MGVTMPGSVVVRYLTEPQTQSINRNYHGSYLYGAGPLHTLFRPMWFLAENVGGLRNANDGRAFTKILSELPLPARADALQQLTAFTDIRVEYRLNGHIQPVLIIYRRNRQAHRWFPSTCPCEADRLRGSGPAVAN